MTEPSWRRAVSDKEAAFIAERYARLSERWRQRFPGEEPPPCGGDAIQRIRCVQLMVNRLRRDGVPTDEIVGLVRGPGMEVEDAELRQAKEQAVTAPEKPETNGDPGSR